MDKSADSSSIFGCILDNLSTLGGSTLGQCLKCYKEIFGLANHHTYHTYKQ